MTTIREFTDREYTVVTNVWGENIPKQLDKIADDQLWDIQHKASTAAQDSRDEDEPEMMSLLLMIESKVSYVLAERSIVGGGDFDGGGEQPPGPDNGRPRVSPR